MDQLGNDTDERAGDNIVESEVEETTWSRVKHKKRSTEVWDDDDSVVNASKLESEEEDVSDVPVNSFGDDDNEVNEESNGCSEFTAFDRVQFSKQFKSMITEKKWKLRSGRYVEDIMHKLGERCSYHHTSRFLSCKYIFLNMSFRSILQRGLSIGRSRFWR